MSDSEIRGLGTRISLLCPMSSPGSTTLLAQRCSLEPVDAMIVQRWERSLETSVILLSFACSRISDRSSGAVLWLRTGVDLAIGCKAKPGVPPTAASPPPLHDV